MKKTITGIATISILASTFLLGRYFDILLDNENMSSMNLEIYPQEKNFIEVDEIRKLIKIQDSSLKKIDVKSLENKLEKNAYISNAEVYKDLNDHVVAEIEQYHPMARVLGETSYYIDVSGTKKPLSNHYTEHVMLVFGELTGDNQKEVIRLIQMIDNDRILKEMISEIHLKNNHIRLKTDGLKADIIIDLKGNLEKELYKLKAIYAYLNKEKLENKYQQIDLRYEKQAVCK